MKKIVKGQKVWLVQSGRRRNDPVSITETEVIGIGPKYFRIACDNRNKYHVETGKLVTDYSTSTLVYANIQEYHDKVEHGNLSDIIRSRLNGYWSINLPLDKLRRIAAIMNEKTEES